MVTAPGSGAEVIPFLKTYVNLPMAIGFSIIYAKVSLHACCHRVCRLGECRHSQGWSRETRRHFHLSELTEAARQLQAHVLQQQYRRSSAARLGRIYAASAGVRHVSRDSSGCRGASPGCGVRLMIRTGTFAAALLPAGSSEADNSSGQPQGRHGRSSLGGCTC